MSFQGSITQTRPMPASAMPAQHPAEQDYPEWHGVGHQRHFRDAAMHQRRLDHSLESRGLRKPDQDGQAPRWHGKRTPHGQRDDQQHGPAAHIAHDHEIEGADVRHHHLHRDPAARPREDGNHHQQPCDAVDGILSRFHFSSLAPAPGGAPAKAGILLRR
jgi:hypothetical protein